MCGVFLGKEGYFPVVGKSCRRYELRACEGTVASRLSQALVHDLDYSIKRPNFSGVKGSPYSRVGLLNRFRGHRQWPLRSIQLRDYLVR